MSRTLDLKQLIGDYKAGKLEVQFPTFYDVTISPKESVEKLDEKFITFFKDVLDASRKAKAVAKKFGVESKDITEVWDKWDSILYPYYAK